MKQNSVIAIASGKGGTGKTSLAVNLASYIAVQSDSAVTLFDLDVEEPNTAIFFEEYRKNSKSRDVFIKIPEIDKDRCTLCGICSEKCNYNAVVQMKNSILIMKEMCKSCHRCKYECPQSAITMKDSQIGEVNSYYVQNMLVHEGKMKIGDIHSKELISQTKKLKTSGTILYDAPPGTTCPMVEAVIDADYVVLVTEPTPFGLHDLSLAIQVVETLRKPFGIVINKSGTNDVLIESYSDNNHHTIIGKIPFSREIAEQCGNGNLYYRQEPYASELNQIIKSWQEALI
jgi:MinD superfamily P-loop ATPase